MPRRWGKGCTKWSVQTVAAYSAVRGEGVPPRRHHGGALRTSAKWSQPGTEGPVRCQCIHAGRAEASDSADREREVATALGTVSTGDGVSVQEDDEVLRSDGGEGRTTKCKFLYFRSTKTEKP